MSRKALIVLALVVAFSCLAPRAIAQETSLHPSWPIENGVKHQPTQNELRALHDQDVSSKDAQEIDRLYNELMQSGGSGRTHHTGIARMR